MRSIAWLSEKGGTGKTTCVVNVAVALAKLGRRVLVVDADPQANASLVLLAGQGADTPTLLDVLTNEADAADAIRPTGTEGLDIIPADSLLADANVSLAAELGRERRLRLAMRGVDDAYDFVVIDTSPQRTLLNVNVLNYAAEVYCPVDPGIFSIAGLVKLREAVAGVVQYLDNRELRIAGLVVTRAQRDNLTRDTEAQLRTAFGPLVLETTIPASIKVGEAHARYQSVIDYARFSAAARAYEKLTGEILSHGQDHGTRDGVDVGAAEVDRPGGPGRRPRRAG
jgi:chromosome partitioning protein